MHNLLRCQIVLSGGGMKCRVCGRVESVDHILGYERFLRSVFIWCLGGWDSQSLCLVRLEGYFNGL